MTNWHDFRMALYIAIAIAVLVGAPIYLAVSYFQNIRDAECMAAGGFRYERMRRVGPTCWTEDGRRVWVKEWE